MKTECAHWAHHRLHVVLILRFVEVFLLNDYAAFDATFCGPLDFSHRRLRRILYHTAVQNIKTVSAATSRTRGPRVPLPVRERASRPFYLSVS